MCGRVRRQLMHEYVQKSTSTTLPRRPVIESGRLVLNQCEMPVKSGAAPKLDNPSAASRALGAWVTGLWLDFPLRSARALRTGALFSTLLNGVFQPPGSAL